MHVKRAQSQSPRAHTRDASGARPLRARARFGTQKRKQCQRRLASISNAQLFIATVERKRSDTEWRRPRVGLELSGTFDHKQHQIRCAVAVRRERMTRRYADESYLAVIAFEQRARNETSGIVDGPVLDARRFHPASIALSPR